MLSPRTLHGRLHLLPAYRQHGLPTSLPGESWCRAVRVKEFSAASGLLDGELKATRGKRDDDHPRSTRPSDPPGALGVPKKRVYELVVRRSGDLQPPMITESTRRHRGRVETYFVRGSVVVDRGYGGIYSYARSADEEIPALQEGQELAIDGEPWIVDKETQPPGRISQAKLIEMMEERGLGTKATRADIIQKLFDRGYVYSNPPIPTETGIALYEAFKNYVPAMATPEMTAQLEAEMDRIAAGEMSKGSVVSESRDLLHKTWTESTAARDLAKVIWKGMDEDRILGPCKVCEEAGVKGRRLAAHAADHPRQKIGQTLRRLQRLDPRRPGVVRPDLPPAPARRRLQARGPLLDLRPDAAAESPALPRSPLEPLPQRRLRVDAGDEETAGRARSRESRQSAMSKKPPVKGDEALPQPKKAKSSVKADTARAGANAPKPRPKAEAAGVVHLALGC